MERAGTLAAVALCCVALTACGDAPSPEVADRGSDLPAAVGLDEVATPASEPAIPVIRRVRPVTLPDPPPDPNAPWPDNPLLDSLGYEYPPQGWPGNNRLRDRR